MKRNWLLLAIVLWLLPFPALAESVTIDFENLPDLTSVTTQYAGVSFSNATVLTAGTSLNEFEYPPHSGMNVIFDDGGAMSLSFAAAITSFSGFFTYGELPSQNFTYLVLQGFDAGNNLVASVSSAFSSNLGLSGDPASSPNELLQLSYAAGISRITITGDPFGGSFTADDLTFTTPTPAPEPSSLALLGTGFALALIIVRPQTNR